MMGMARVLLCGGNALGEVLSARGQNPRFCMCKHLVELEPSWSRVGVNLEKIKKCVQQSRHGAEEWFGNRAVTYQCLLVK